MELESLDTGRNELELNMLFTLFSYYLNVKYYEKKLNEINEASTFTGWLKNKTCGNESATNKLLEAKEVYNHSKCEMMDEGFNDFSDQRMSILVSSLFGDDVTYEKRIVFSIQFVIAMENELVYEVKKEAFEKISTILNFPFADTLTRLLSAFKKNWQNICIDKAFNMKLAIIAGAVALPITIATFPYAITAIPGSLGVTLASMGGGAVAAGGAGMVGGMILTSFLSVATSGVLGATVYYAKKHFDKKELVSAYADLTPSDLSYILANNITIIQFVKTLYGKSTTSTHNRSEFLVELEYKLHKRLFVENFVSKENFEKNDMIKASMNLLEKQYA